MSLLLNDNSRPVTVVYPALHILVVTSAHAADMTKRFSNVGFKRDEKYILKARNNQGKKRATQICNRRVNKLDRVTLIGKLLGSYLVRQY